MPQPTNLSNKSKKKVANSSGRIPAYNNEFAFRHNPKSKKTASILASPIQYCCRRCHDKLVWRKTYRKYKPLTQPTSCNLCHKRNITAAYHTVCNACSISHPKAILLLDEWNSNINNKKANRKNAKVAALNSDSNDKVDDVTSSLDTAIMLSAEQSDTPSQHKQLHTERAEEEEGEDDGEKEDIDEEVNVNRNNEPSMSSARRHKRVCTVCFKQPAVPDDDTECNDDDDDGTTGSTNRPMKLRQVKSLQRQLERQQQDGQQSGRKKDAVNHEKAQDDNNNDGDNDDNDNSNSDDDEEDYDEDEQGFDCEFKGKYSEEDGEDETRCGAPMTELNQVRTTTSTTLDAAVDDDEMDPFLQAIGGVQNLLVGEAYQKMLLEKNTKR